MTRKDLKNKPLVEAILELKWEIPPQKAQSLEGDPHYRLLLGRFSDRVQNQYPAHEQLPAAQVPDGMLAHAAQHRFRTSKGGWPLLQIGHGLMTVNDTESYTWPDFRKRAERAVKDLYASHPAKDEFRIKELVLRYIDAIDVNFEEEKIFDFLRDKMKITIGLPEGLFASEQVAAKPGHFQWETTFPTHKPEGNISLKLGTGQRKDTPAVILETRVHTLSGQLPIMPSNFSDWLAQAHNLTDDWFFQLIEGELEKRFS